MNHFSRTQSRLAHRGQIRPLLFCALLVLSALSSACNRADNSAAANSDPDQLLRQMSDKLSQAKQFSVEVARTLDPALVEGRNVVENARIQISVSRPNKLLAKSSSREDVRQIFFDGQNVSIYDQTMKLYATAPVPGSIDEVVAKVDEKYNFTPPFAEFILSDPYRALGQQIKSKAYKGREYIERVECHHLTLSGDVADSELWIGTADLLPRKLVATFKNREGNPKLEASFSNWNLTAPLDKIVFTFVAPKDAEKVDMVTDAQVKETAAKTAKADATAAKH